MESDITKIIEDALRDGDEVKALERVLRLDNLDALTKLEAVEYGNVDLQTLLSLISECGSSLDDYKKLTKLIDHKKFALKKIVANLQHARQSHLDSYVENYEVGKGAQSHFQWKVHKAVLGGRTVSLDLKFGRMGRYYADNIPEPPEVDGYRPWTLHDFYAIANVILQASGTPGAESLCNALGADCYQYIFNSRIIKNGDVSFINSCGDGSSRVDLPYVCHDNWIRVGESDEKVMQLLLGTGDDIERIAMVLNYVRRCKSAYIKHWQEEESGTYPITLSDGNLRLSPLPRETERHSGVTGRRVNIDYTCETVLLREI